MPKVWIHEGHEGGWRLRGWLGLGRRRPSFVPNGNHWRYRDFGLGGRHAVVRVQRVDDQALKRRAPHAGDEWLTYGLTQSETRFSPLADINASQRRASGLRPGRYEVGPGGGGQEATPLVWNGTIFGITNWSVVFAVDARTGKERGGGIRK